MPNNIPILVDKFNGLHFYHPMSQSLTNSNISSSTTINCRSASGYGDNGRYRRGSYNQYKEEKMGKINKNLPTSGITATTTNTRKNINSYDY